VRVVFDERNVRSERRNQEAIEAELGSVAANQQRGRLRKIKQPNASVLRNVNLPQAPAGEQSAHKGIAT